jgi:hypothetical protein
LVDAPPRVQGAFGGPAWVVRVDANGNPAVRTDPATGTLYAPFVDQDGDGIADVNAAGDPVDASGQTISIPPFGPLGGPGYDADGRALAASGDLIYDFFDAKRTLLSHFLQLGGEGLRRGIHEMATDVAAIALGPRVPNDNGTPGDPSDDFNGFDPGNPVTDLGWGLLQIAKYDGVPKLLRAVAQMQRTDPALFERTLVAIGKVVEKLRPIALAPSQTPPTAQTRALADRAIGLADQVFSTSSQPSTGRVLFDVLHQLGQSARDLPGQLALMVDYKTLVLDASGHVDTVRSVLVDRTRPATKAGSSGGENRSVLQQLLDLIADADGCKTFLGLFGAPLSETIIEVMAGQSPAFVGTLTDFVDNPIVQGYLALACSPIKSEVLSLKSLSASGALNGFLPIAKVFVDKGETRLLIDILKTLDQSYGDSVLPYEPQLSDLLKSGAIEAAFDLDDLLVAGGAGGQPIADPTTGDHAIDVIADAIATLLAHPAGGVADRLGRAQPTLAHLAIAPLRRIEDAMFAASGGQALHNALGYAVTDLLIERTTVNGVEVLTNPSVAPFFAHALDLLARNLPATAADRAKQLTDVQTSFVSFMGSRHFATAFDLALTLRNATGGAAIRDAVINLLTPNPVAADDVFGSLLKLAVEVLETKVDTAPLRDIAAFAGDLLDPQQQKVTGIVDGVSRVLQADKGKVVITLVRNALNVPPTSAGLAAGKSPAVTLMSVYDDVRAAAHGGQASSGALQVADLTWAIDAIVQFIRDPNGGLQRIFDVIRNRP